MKWYLVAHKNYVKFKFYCPWIVFIGYSHALRSTYCLGLSLYFKDRAEQLGQRPGELQSLRYLLSDPVENVCCSELIEHSSSRESERSGHTPVSLRLISWLSLVSSRSQSLKKKNHWMEYLVTRTSELGAKSPFSDVFLYFWQHSCHFLCDKLTLCFGDSCQREARAVRGGRGSLKSQTLACLWPQGLAGHTL